MLHHHQPVAQGEELNVLGAQFLVQRALEQPVALAQLLSARGRGWKAGELAGRGLLKALLHGLVPLAGGVVDAAGALAPLGRVHHVQMVPLGVGAVPLRRLDKQGAAPDLHVAQLGEGAVSGRR